MVGCATARLDGEDIHPAGKGRHIDGVAVAIGLEAQHLRTKDGEETERLHSLSTIVAFMYGIRYRENRHPPLIVGATEFPDSQRRLHRHKSLLLYSVE